MKQKTNKIPPIVREMIEMLNNQTRKMKEMGKEDDERLYKYFKGLISIEELKAPLKSYSIEI